MEDAHPLTPGVGRQDSKLRIPESNSLGAPEDGVAPLRQTPRVGPLMSWLTPAYQPFRKPWGSTRSFEMQSFESCRPSHGVGSARALSACIGDRGDARASDEFFDLTGRRLRVLFEEPADEARDN